jgi:outer membrane immunogenic protein
MLRCILLASAGALALTGAAFAADLAPPPVYLSPQPVMTWTGFYAGLNAGYTFGGSNSVDVETASQLRTGGIGVDLGRSDEDRKDGREIKTPTQSIADAVAASATDVLSLHNSGFIGGGQVGYNLQFANSWLIGIEADIQGTGARSSASAIGIVPIAGRNLSEQKNSPEIDRNRLPPSTAQAQSNISVNNAVDYLGTVRGRLGYLVTPTLLIYGDGGFAYGGVHEGVDIASTFPPSGLGLSPAFGSFTNTRPGWTAGGGLEWLFSPNWSVKAEYLYYDLGRVTFGVGGMTLATAGATFFTDLPVASTRFNGHIVRVGLNYHFNWWGAGPVVAKY